MLESKYARCEIAIRLLREAIRQYEKEKRVIQNLRKMLFLSTPSIAGHFFPFSLINVHASNEKLLDFGVE